jgi:hypothetical protein
MLIRIGIGNVLDCRERCSEFFFELSDEPFPDILLLIFPLLDDLDRTLGTVVLLHLDFSSTGGGRLLLRLSSDKVVFREREARDPSRELFKSRNDVADEGGTAGEVDKGVNRNRILEGP